MMRDLMSVLWRGRRGFTLIELLVVVAIIGILATLAIPKITGAIDDARAKKAIADLNIISSALDRFYSDYEFYPPSLDALINPTTYYTSATKNYLDKSTNFKNAHGKYYFYAVRLDAASDNDNFQSYVLGDPGKHPATNSAAVASYSTYSATDPLPQGKTPSSTGGSWFYTTTGTAAYSTIAEDGVVPASPATLDRLDLEFEDPDAHEWNFNNLEVVTAVYETSKPSRSDLRTN